MIRTNQLEFYQKSNFKAPIKPQIPLKSLLCAKIEWKGGLIELAAVLYNFSGETILFDVIRTNEF